MTRRCSYCSTVHKHPGSGCPDTPDKRYRDEIGEPNNLPEDHPDRWMWEYRGTPDERRDLLDRLQECADRDAPPTQDETLF